MQTKTKICGLTRPADIEIINAAKPDYIGFVFAESRRKVSPKQAQELKSALQKEIQAVGVFVNEPIENILSLVQNHTIDIVQLHGTEDESYILTLRKKTTAPIIKAIPIQKSGDAQSWQNTSADYLLLDNKTGGTGKAFDWGLIGTIDKPFFLAGGLSPENVALAVSQVKPYAVDVSSGVENKNNQKCATLINSFLLNTTKKRSR
ncbi:MAG: phosphoribosylanthranilate isomerase [Defluviitaleaceae bacterium]|nr:phosphoribosylanthranilate isomerase [Defluviitaleaceae bacterium]